MSNSASVRGYRRGFPWGALVLVVLSGAIVYAMVTNTKVVKIGSADDIQNDVFSPDRFAASELPKIKESIESRAVDARELAQAMLEDKKAAAEKYGVAATVGHVVPVKFVGVAGEVKSGVYNVEIEGVPSAIRVRIQTGPAINGTDLRDATGKIEFGQFTNQIEYQDVGSALNREMKKDALSDIDTTALTGKTIVVTGVFKLLNPKNWFVTPVRFSVE